MVLVDQNAELHCELLFLWFCTILLLCLFLYCLFDLDVKLGSLVQSVREGYNIFSCIIGFFVTQDFDHTYGLRLDGKVL